MSLIARSAFLFCFLISALSSFCQRNNSKPEIVGQAPSPLITNKNQPITISLSNLIVKDSDPQPVYPNGFSLDISSGNDYQVNRTTVTPDQNFTGTLQVRVRVNDGRNNSARFNLQVDVLETNVAPVITGQQTLTMKQGENLTVSLGNLKVSDPDNNYPQDFTLKVFTGSNYAVSGTTITPSPGFAGSLNVAVTVNDGKSESNKYDLKIEVLKRQNTPPQIIGQDILKINEEENITIQLSNLKVFDPDNSYPKDFTLKITSGSNYSFSGTTITPAKDFSGTLTVSLLVNDGSNDSAPYSLKITVNAVNDAPVITGQIPVATNKGTSLPIEFSYLIVQDPDNNYPGEFKLKVLKGSNYSMNGNIVIPAPSFTGILKVNVVVSDGFVDSQPYELKIDVISPIVNIAPIITGQKLISITENSSLTLQLGHLTVTDPDNEYPNDFTIKVFSGVNYSVEGTTVTPLPNFSNGTLSVTVKVNDDNDDSAPFKLQIKVVPLNSRPNINGQKELATMEDSTTAIKLTDLYVTDADNPNYPQGFSLRILPGNNYTYNIDDNNITPASNYTGFINVGVTVSDGINTSEEFKVSILITPVNDAPEILNFERIALEYEPGKGAINISDKIDLRDVDSEHLSMAEIGFNSENYSALHDKLIFTKDSSKIKAIWDPDGILFLIGNASLEEYKNAIRSIEYNYTMTYDQNGNPSEILTGTRTLYIILNDGQDVSQTQERQLNMEIKISLDIPNAFTPNGDNSNDTWQVRATNKDNLRESIIRVYNKRGLLIYESKGFDKAWDGFSNGQLLPVDTYYYTIDLNLSYLKKTYKGAVTLLH